MFEEINPIDGGNKIDIPTVETKPVSSIGKVDLTNNMSNVPLFEEFEEKAIVRNNEMVDKKTEYTEDGKVKEVIVADMFQNNNK